MWPLSHPPLSSPQPRIRHDQQHAAGGPAAGRDRRDRSGRRQHRLLAGARRVHAVAADAHPRARDRAAGPGWLERQGRLDRPMRPERSREGLCYPGGVSVVVGMRGSVGGMRGML